MPNQKGSHRFDKPITYIEDHKKGLVVAGVAAAGVAAYAYHQFEKQKKQNSSQTKLHVRLISGEHLLAKDSGGTSDPYVVFKQDHVTVKSKVIPKTLNPVWNENLEIGISDLHKELEIEVWDKDLFSDDAMGHASIPIAALSSTPQEVVLKLKGDAGLFSRNHGKLKLLLWITVGSGCSFDIGQQQPLQLPQQQQQYYPPIQQGSYTPPLPSQGYYQPAHSYPHSYAPPHNYGYASYYPR
jgi:hypothetical protein